MHPTRHLVARVLAFVAAAALVTVLGVPTAFASEAKTFTGQKICKPPVVPIQFMPPKPGGYCVVTASTLEILEGAKIYLTNATLIGGVLDSPATLVVTDRRASTATGHCTYYFPTPTTAGHGLCAYWSGTGKLKGFHANEVSGPPTPLGVSMTGTYWFDRDHEEDD